MTNEEILSLTPLKPISHREQRYLGGAFSLRLENFSIDEQEIIQRIYEITKEIFAMTDADSDLSAPDRQKLTNFLSQSELPQLQEQLIQLVGEAQLTNDIKKEAVLYSLASGALSSIASYGLLVSQGGLEREYIQSLYYLTRDQLKISRNLIEDLDAVKRAADEAPKMHSLDLLKEKWESVTYRSFASEIDVAFHQYYQGHVAERCLEFAEIDNIFYHLANNAVQYGTKAVLDIGIAPVNEGKDLRWVFRNPINGDQAATLKELSTNGKSIFEHGVSSAHKNGEGFGLGSVADTILHAYGQEDLYEAEKQGYFGWTVKDDLFSLWFHWPAIDGAS
ncbi:MAG: hypothetical protein LAT55_07725 [Opitutales bacterium]|nr:hypothetical protein [Opitutales bacterium]